MTEIIETIPTIYMYNEEIVEVGFTEWISRDGGETWGMPTGSRFVTKLDNPINRVVVELPNGCFEWELSELLMKEGDSLQVTISPGGAPLQRCYRYRELLERAALERGADAEV